MTTTVQAIYSNGALYPVKPLDVTESDTVMVTVAPADSQLSEDAIIDRVAQSTTIED